MLPGFAFLAGGLWRMVSLGVMGWTAFGPDRSGWSRSMLFVLLSMALGGLAVSLETGGAGLPLCAGGLAALCRMGLRSRGGEKVPIAVTYRGRTVRTMALQDTGNTLRDPITGENVTVLSPRLGMKLGIPEDVLRDPAASLLPGLRLIPARTVGGGGLLAAVRCERVVIDGRAAGRLVAFARENFRNGEYQALTGGSYG
jgi:stage II sporulation protein GA (sporulation sigma-E factor processing peptidase)